MEETWYGRPTPNDYNNKALMSYERSLLLKGAYNVTSNEGTTKYRDQIHTNCFAVVLALHQ
jgi:hypothetical protein